MKTIEEKAKAYDEALEKARPLYEQAKKDGNPIWSTYEYLIPELRESEDERIRKALIEALTISESIGELKFRFPEPTRQECIAYLEKQKEQKPTSFNEPYNPDEYEVVMEGNATSLKRKEQKPADYCSVRDEFDLNGNLKQKPAWSEEDEKKIHFLSRLIEFQVKDDEYCFGGNHRMVSKQEAIEMLLSLRPQPKKERQIKEGDKVSIHCRKDRKEDMITIYDGKVGEVIHVWDAKRNPWGHIVVRLDNGCNNGFYEDELEVLDKSHWKPSKEEMKALLNAEGILREQRHHFVTAGLLAKLYEQLKKL